MTDDRSGDSPEKLVFHYNRERRLEHAPESVRRAYEEGYTPNKGFIKGLTANAGLRSILFVIVILCVSIGFVTFFGTPAGSQSINGVHVQLKAFLYDETVYVTLAFSEKEWSGSDPVPVSVLLEGSGSERLAVVSDEAYGIYSGKSLTLRTALPDHEIQFVDAKIAFGTVNSHVRVQVDRK